MPALAFNHFNLRADKQLTAALREFYIEFMGLYEGWRPSFDFPGHWLYLGEQPILHLVEDNTMFHATESDRKILDHVAFMCEGLSAFERALDSRRIQYRRSTVPGTRQVQLILSDPAGNGVELIFSSSDA
jgi:catechol-2,3-dioxygenase